MTTPSGICPNIDTDTFTAYSDALQAAALATTRMAATSLPADLAFHRSIDPTLSRDVDSFSDRVLALVNKLVHVASGNGSRLREEEDVVDELVRNIVDPMEGMLESTDDALDALLGKRKGPAIHVSTVPVDPHQRKPKKQPIRGRLDPALTHASHIPKPQLLFKHVLSNVSESPYIPATLIPHKWCARVPLGYVFRNERSEGDAGGDLEDDEEERRKRTLHPYYYELTHPSYPDHVFNPPAKPSLPSSLDVPSARPPTVSHPLTFVSTPKAFLAMANTISSEIELAIDLEHHSYRSYKGFLALMQISTRRTDFVVDLLIPEIREGLRQARGKSIEDSEEARMASDAGQIIARVFADSSIMKVFHGAESDIVWLQQDFNIFVVGLFDTYHASKLLESPKHSLAYLLEAYCDFIPDKRYQLADWRIRPLPAEMSTYARSDTHFLLYIYDILRLSLVERPPTSPGAPEKTGSFVDAKQAKHGHIYAALTRSARTALRLYETEVYDAEGGTGPSGWDTLARKWNKVALVGSPMLRRGTEAEGLQAAVYKAVHRWREDAAREEDESTRYVLSTHHLFLLAERIPTSVPDLLSAFGGSGGVHGNVPPVLKRRTAELVEVIKGVVGAIKSTSGPRAPVEDRCAGGETVASTVVGEPKVMNTTTPSPSTAKASCESRLWSITPSATSAVTISISRSSFGVALSGESAEVTSPSVYRKANYSASGSLLFGSALAETATASSPSRTRSTFMYADVLDDSAERFKDLMEKIHKTLVIAPIVPKSPVTAPVQAQALEASCSDVPVDVGTNKNNSAASDIPLGPAGQIEIPFVPAHKRQTLSNPQNYEPKDDAIVVVGQTNTRQRKRKRDKSRVVSTSQSKSGAQLGGIEPSIHTDDQDQEVEEFDYSSTPNLLDNESMDGDTRGMHEEDERRKKKQRHGKGSGRFEYGNFRTAPRDQREVKSGNKTYTFR